MSLCWYLYLWRSKGSELCSWGCPWHCWSVGGLSEKFDCSTWVIFIQTGAKTLGSFALLQSGFVIIAHYFILTSWMWWQGFKGVENVNVCKCCEERAVDQVWQTKAGGLGSFDRILLIFEDQLPRCYNTLSPLCRGTFALGQAQLVTSSMLKSKRDHVCLDSLWFAIVFNSRRKFK